MLENAIGNFAAARATPAPAACGDVLEELRHRTSVAYKSESTRATGFLDLTPEVRNMVYRLLLLDHTPIRVEPVGSGFTASNDALLDINPSSHGQCGRPTVSSRLSPRSKQRTISLLLANRLIAAETIPVLYSNTVEFKHLDDLNAFLEHIGRLSRHLRHIRLLDWTPFPLLRPAPDFSKFTRASGLRTLNVCFAQLYGRERQEQATGLKMFSYAIRPILKHLQGAMRGRGTPREVLDIVQPVLWKSWAVDGQNRQLHGNRNGGDNGLGWEQKEVDGIRKMLRVMIAQMAGMKA